MCYIASQQHGFFEKRKLSVGLLAQQPAPSSKERKKAAPAVPEVGEDGSKPAAQHQALQARRTTLLNNAFMKE
jgi:hypothetical protein